MNKIVLSRLATYLTILVLSALTVSDCQLAQAAQPADAIQVDANFVPALLTSMSSLVPSPFADPASLNNPLGVHHSVTPRSDVMRAVVSHNVSHHAATALDANTKEPTPKIALPHTRDFTLTLPVSISFERSIKEISPVKNSFAMTGR